MKAGRKSSGSIPLEKSPSNNLPTVSVSRTWRSGLDSVNENFSAKGKILSVGQTSQRTKRIRPRGNLATVRRRQHEHDAAREAVQRVGGDDLARVEESKAANERDEK